MKYPFLLLTASLIAGIIIATVMPVTLWSGVAVIFSALTVWTVSLRSSGSSLPSSRVVMLQLICVIVLFSGIGMVARTVNVASHTDFTRLEHPVTAVVDEISTLTSGDRIIGEAAGQRIIIHCKAAPVNPGDIVSLPPHFRRIGSNPNLYQEDYAGRMRSLGLEYEISVSGEELIPIGRSPHPKYAARSLRDDLARGIDATPLSKTTRDLLNTLLLGERNTIDHATRQVFSDAGISHLLALSGMHIAIVASIILCLLFPVNLAGQWRWRYFAAVIILWAYTFLTGMAPSTVRASLMATFLFAGITLQRRGNALNTLCASAFVLLLFSPDVITDLGAQLSYLSVASLIVFVGPLNGVEQRRHPRLYAVTGALLTSMVAFAATWPLVMYHFGRLPLLFLPVNIIVLPLLPFYVGCALIYLVTYAIGVEIAPLALALDSGCSCLLRLSSWISGDGRAVMEGTVSSASVVMWCVALICASIFVLSGFSRRRKAWLCGAGVFTLFAVGVLWLPRPKAMASGFIVQSYLTAIQVLTIDDGKEAHISMPRGKISEIELSGHRIVSVDTGLNDGDTAGESCKYSYMIIASGYRGNLAELLDRFMADTIVVHTSVRKRRELELIEEAEDIGIHLHSLRLHGPLRNISVKQVSD